MRFILGVAVLISSVVASAGPCEEMIKKLDPKASAQAPIITIGQFKFNFLSTAVNPTSSCAFTVAHVNQKRRYNFMDDGSFVISTDIGKAGKSADTKVQSFFLLPQEKGKNFSVVRAGNIVTLKMNAGDFTFDTAAGKMISNSSLTVQDSATAVDITQPQGLLVGFGTAMGGNPREKVGMARVNHRTASCQFDKAKLLEGIGDKKNYDKNIRVRTSDAQINLVKANCPGMRLQIATTAPAGVTPKNDGILSPEFEKRMQGLR